MSVFSNAPAGSFLIDNDGLTVRNTKDLVWGKFMMDNKKQGSVANHGFSAQLDAGRLSADLIEALEDQVGVYLSGYAVSVTTAGSQWLR